MCLTLTPLADIMLVSQILFSKIMSRVLNNTHSLGALRVATGEQIISSETWP